MKGRSDKILLFDIIESCQRIADYIGGVRKRDYESDYQLQDALVRKLEVIGEAAKGVSMELRNENAQVPWQQLMGMRDRIVHQYFRVDLDIVWKTVKKDVPELKRQITSLYDSLG